MPKTILAIDDESEFLSELKLWLNDEGYEVLTVSRGEEALEQAKQAHPDLILLDVNMPETDGLEVLSQLKRNFDTSTIPVIMLTAREESGYILRSRELKANDYVMKPFNQEELLTLIHRYEK